MSKDSFFNLIHHLQKQQPNQNYFTNMLYLTNCIIHIIIYFSFPLYSLTNFPSITPGSTGIITLLSFALSLPIQMVLFLTKKKQIYLRNQLLFFRFVVSPILTLRLIQSANSSIIPPALATVCIIFIRSFSYFLSKFILYENQRHYSLKVQQTSIIAKMQIIEIAIIFNLFVVETKIQFILAVFLVLFCYYVSYRFLSRMENQQVSYQILVSMNLLYLFMFTIYVGIMMFDLVGARYFLTVFIPLLVIAGWSISRQRRMAKDNMVLLLSKKLNYKEFVQSADGFLMVLKQDAPSRKRVKANYIMAIFSAHHTSCDMPTCEIQASNTKQQLRSLSSKSIDQLTQKAVKKLQWIFQQYHRSNADNLNISFALLKFYGQFLPNKAKMQNLLSDIEVQELGLAFECEYSKYKKICTNIQNVENIDVIKDEDIYLEFRTTMISTLNSMIEFWNEFGEERVDLAKITAITAKLFPLKAKIESIFKQELNREKFTTYRILKLYSSYTRLILNRWEQAAKVQDFLQILAQRLKDKQDIQFLSKESEAGFVVICLSESKLGNIFMVNQKACTLFRYAKKDILNLRVNAIMPNVFADIHDQILTDFLKKKRKKYNTDQRLLFGKDGNGYIFPVMLQLQRASFSANDEFIFIASVAPAKLKSSPIYCIVDHEGNINDFTSTFRTVFFQKSKKDLKKNIQQIIPSYFDEDFSELSQKVRNFTFTIDSRKLRGVQASGQSSPLIVKGVHEGFLIKIQYDHQRTMSAYKNLCLTENMKNLIFNENTKSYENIYQSINNFFQIEGGKPHRILGSLRKRQFTLPFLNYQDMAILAQPMPEKKDYGKGIKMVRYIKNHYERIEDEESFHSDTYKDHHQESLKQIEEMQSARKKSESSLLLKVKVAVALAVMLTFLVLGVIHGRYTILINDQRAMMESHHRSKIIFVQLSEYIVSFTLQERNIYPDFFKEVKESLKTALIDDINQANLSQLYKQEMTRILYLQSSQILQKILNDSYKIDANTTQMEGILDSLWGGAIAITIIISLIFPIMFYQLKTILFQIYLLFIDIKDPIIKQIDTNCHSLIDKIRLQIQQNVQKQQEKKEMELKLEEQGELQKKRRFKNTERTKDLYMLIKILTPLLLIIGLLFFALFLSKQKFTTYEVLREQHGKILEIVPSGSIQFMKMALKLLNNLTLTVGNNYKLHYQEFQTTILKFTEQMQGQNFLNFLYGDICAINQQLFDELSMNCKQLGYGIMTHGVSPTINYLAQDLQNIKTSLQESHLKIIFILQFFFINPTILHIEQQMSSSLSGYLDSISLLFQSIAIIASSLLAIFYLYLILYPLNAIEQQITFTSEMITLVPESSQKHQNSNKSIAISLNNL